MREMIKEFLIDEWKGTDRPIVIYGAGICGEYTLRALQQFKLQPVCFCDRARSGYEYLGLPVYGYEAIFDYQDPVILLAVGSAFWNGVDFLRCKGITEIYNVHELIFRTADLTKENLSVNAKDIEYNKDLYAFAKEYHKDSPKMNMLSLDWVITEKCSLRCKECSNLMQYYQKPENFMYSNLVEEMEQVLSFVDEIMDVRIIGGEPFMHPQLAEIMEKFLECPQIHNFSIFTNATILPNERMIKILKNKKVKCIISDYGELVKNFPEFMKIMSHEGIRHRVTKSDEWHKLGGLFDRKCSESQMRNVFENCYCNDLFTLLEGKIYRCPYSAHGRVLEAIPFVEEDFLDIYNGSYEYLRNKLKFIVFEKKFDHACSYCDGRNYHLKVVKPAEQIDRPIEYTKFFEGEKQG